MFDKLADQYGLEKIRKLSLRCQAVESRSLEENNIFGYPSPVCELRKRTTLRTRRFRLLTLTNPF
jgi:hypothetical protein